MNLESINKWLDEEYGCSYTRLEELHNFYFEKYTDQKEEINRLNNIIEQIKEYIEYSLNNPLADERLILQMVLAKLKVELKGDNK